MCKNSICRSSLVYVTWRAVPTSQDCTIAQHLHEFIGMRQTSISFPNYVTWSSGQDLLI